MIIVTQWFLQGWRSTNCGFLNFKKGQGACGMCHEYFKIRERGNPEPHIHQKKKVYAFVQ